jgi:hypothetical protein
MVPPIVFDSTKSPAERRVFDKLEHTELDTHACALHSVNLPRHVYKKMGEVDFVVLSRSGLLVCEVKGGRVAREDGLWTFTNRFGETNFKREGPFKQAESAMWSLEADLKERIPKEQLRQVSFGYCVIFTDVSYREDSVDAPKELVIDGDEFVHRRDLAIPLERLLTLWRKRNHGGDMSPQTLHEVQAALRGSFDLVPSLRLRAADSVARMERLTEEQYQGLDWVETEARLLISGGAGTGKTFLALEMARRDAVRHERVLLTCESPMLAAFLGERSSGFDVADIESARGIAAANGPFDVVVVDEAQDVFTLDGVSVLDELCAGGIEHGRWRCLYDLNNQAGLRGDADVEAFGLLSGTGAHQVVLRRNCRNTKAVVLQTQTLTAADLGVPMAGEGPKVSYRFARDDAEEATLVGEELERLSREDVLAGEITIVTGRTAETSPLRLLDPQLYQRLVRFDEAVAAAWPQSHTTWARVDDFKGFENDFVLVCGLASLDGTQADLARLYIGMSRARFGLYMVIPSTLQARFDELRRSNYKAVLAAREGDK